MRVLLIANTILAVLCLAAPFRKRLRLSEGTTPLADVTYTVDFPTDGTNYFMTWDFQIVLKTGGFWDFDFALNQNP